MNSRLRLRFLLGCLLVAALQAPFAWRVLVQDMRGPYVQPAVLAARADDARAAFAADCVRRLRQALPLLVGSIGAPRSPSAASLVAELGDGADSAR